MQVPLTIICPCEKEKRIPKLIDVDPTRQSPPSPLQILCPFPDCSIHITVTPNLPLAQTQWIVRGEE